MAEEQKKKAIDLKFKDVITIMPRIILERKRGKQEDDKHKERQKESVLKDYKE